MQERIQEILNEAKEKIAQAATPEDVEQLRVGFLGKKGKITDIFKMMSKLDKEEKKTIAFHIMSEDSDVGTIGMVVGIPGTYDVTEDEVTATFDKEATELKITTLNLLDPELNQLMSADEESRKAIVSMIESQVRSMNDSDLASIGAMSDYFRDFKIFSLTNEKLVIQIGDMKFGFDNVE